MGALNSLQFTGDDFFAAKDVCSIVLEAPNSALALERLACGIALWTARAGVDSGRPPRAGLAICIPSWG